MARQEEAQQSNAARQRTKRERAKARSLLYEITGVTPRVASDTDCDDEPEGVDTPDSGPTLNGNHVSVTPRVAGDTFVSPATLCDTPSQPSLASLSDPSLIRNSDLDRNSVQQASSRVHARESGPARIPSTEKSGSAKKPGAIPARPAGLERPKHPDQDFTDDTLPVAASAYVPSGWLQAEALTSGLDRAALHRTLERYRERSNLPAHATQSQTREPRTSASSRTATS